MDELQPSRAVVGRMSRQRTASGSPHVNRHLAFRDFLRAHPSQAGQYSELKRRLAAAHPNDIEAYMDGKDSFIKGIEAAALAWVATRHPEWRYDAPLCAARQSLLATGAHGVV